MLMELRLPDVGEGIAEGEIVRWMVAEGARVKEDEPLVEVLTDKADMEIPSPADGVVTRILAGAGQTVKVGDVIALIETAGEGLSERGAAEASGKGGQTLATPAVRKLARDLSVDLARVSPTGPGGRITEEDVRRSAVPSADVASAEERIPFRGRRRTAAKKMVLSKTTVPHALLVDEAEATQLLKAREAVREIAVREGIKITILPFIVQAVVAALRTHPAVNASLDEERDEIILKKQFDIGIAVDAPDGLVVPVVRGAGERSLVDLAREIERLADGARAGSLTHADLSGGTFTVTSIGSVGGLFSYPVINPPEAAILGVHKIVRRPVVREGEIAARDMLYLSLSFDHRLIDGGTATRFLNDVIRLIETYAV
jgi:pyruvate dehydrogenase E2 component (dihydrolipoamide acetyltransferase)